MNKQTDECWMQQAIQLAQEGEKQGEVPVGALLVQQGKVLASAYNTPILDKDPTGHAEINVIRKAAQSLNNYRILDSTLYVTLEPCCMCAGAIIQARISRVVFGAFDKKAGACGSVFNMLAAPEVNHHPEVLGGVLQEACSSMLTKFFQAKRLTRITQCCD